MTKRKLLTLRGYARRRGVTHQAVKKAIEAGRIVAVDGKIDPVAADEAWNRNTRAKVDRPPAKSNGHGEAPVDLTSYQAARAERERIQADLARVTLEERLKRLVRADEVQAQAFALARKARDQLVALPDRLAVVLAAETEPEEVRRILEEELERVCAEIAGDQVTQAPPRRRAPGRRGKSRRGKERAR